MPKDLTGNHYGYLVPKSYVGFINRKSIWNCLCEACGNYKEIRSDALINLTHCGCLSKSPEILEQIRNKKRQTNLDRFGVEAPAQLASVRDKMKQTTYQRYGVENALQSEEIKEKIKSKNMIKYGTEWGVQNEDVKEKIKQSNLIKYGVENPMQNVEVQNKKKNTNLGRYGFEVSSKNEQVKEKMFDTNMKRYGVFHTSKILDAKEKSLRTRNISENTMMVLRNKELLTALLDHQNVLNAANELGITDSTICRYARLYNIRDGYRSNLERSVASWLDTLGLEFTTDRKILNGYEIDRYCDAKKLGIEINGLSRHSELLGRKNRYYHLWKYDECARQSIRLIHLFEDEWYDRQLACKTIIKTQLGIQDIGVGARKLIIKPINNKLAKRFFETYHIQGASAFSCCIGAYEGETLVGVMGFGHPTRQSVYQYELKRFCTNGKIYPGLGSRLFQFFIKHHNPSSVVSFCDKRFFLGKSYVLMGFTNDGDIPPDYQYTDYRTRYHKSSFRLAGIRNKFGIDTMGKTEWSIMQEMGYDRIWDCGKIRFVWKNKAPQS